jgi:hypothetical protein
MNTNTLFFSFVDMSLGRVAGPLCPSSESAELQRGAYAGAGPTVPCTVSLPAECADDFVTFAPQPAPAWVATGGVAW